MLMRDLMNLMPHLSIDFHGNHWWSCGLMVLIKMDGIQPSMKQSHPRRSWDWARRMYCRPVVMQLSIVWDPCANRYSSIIVIRSGSAFACLRHSVTSCIDSQRRVTRLSWVHRVMCFDVLLIIPQFVHILSTLESQSKSLLLEPHQPNTCLEMKIRNIFG